MANLKGLMKDTAVYGLSSIVGRFLNYLLVPLYTHYMPKASGDYGVSTNVYAYVALILVLLTFGMETTLFRFANDDKQTLEIGRKHSDTVFSTVMAVVGTLTAVFLLLVFGLIGPISDALGYADHPEYLHLMPVVEHGAIHYTFVVFSKVLQVLVVSGDDGKRLLLPKLFQHGFSDSTANGWLGTASKFVDK